MLKSLILLALTCLLYSCAEPADVSLGAPQDLDSNTTFFDQTIPIGNEEMQVWIYVPKAIGKDVVPCVLVAPAGSNLISGNSLGDGSMPEHLPYVAAGMIVVAYQISHEMHDDDSDYETYRALKGFKQKNAGVDNAKAALDFALKHVKQIDPRNVFAVGHSSAACLALQLSAHETRIKGCVAYAPVLNYDAHFGGKLKAFDESIKNYNSWLMSMSPDNLAQRIKIPVLLFAAQDDGRVTGAQLQEFADMIRYGRGIEVSVETVEQGGHYYPMINTGIPLGIAWIKERAGA